MYPHMPTEMSTREEPLTTTTDQEISRISMEHHRVSHSLIVHQETMGEAEVFRVVVALTLLVLTGLLTIQATEEASEVTKLDLEEDSIKSSEEKEEASIVTIKEKGNHSEEEEEITVLEGSRDLSQETLRLSLDSTTEAEVSAMVRV